MLIIDTDAGTDPDDAVALVVAAKAAPDLALVLTNDEEAGQRARFVRHLLDLAGRPDVPVVAGTELPGTPALVVHHLIPDAVPAQPTGVLAAVRAAIGGDGPGGRSGRRSGGGSGRWSGGGSGRGSDGGLDRVRWLGIGAMTNLALVLTTAPDCAARLDITQMGGALNYRDPSRAEHNVRRDPGSVAAVLAAADRPRFVMSEHTFRMELAINPEAALYRQWRRPGAPAWATVLAEHHDGFFARFHPESLEHDPLTLSAILGEPFVSFADDTIALDELGRMSRHPEGAPVRLSAAVDYDAFLGWLAGWVGLPGAR